MKFYTKNAPSQHFKSNSVFLFCVPFRKVNNEPNIIHDTENTNRITFSKVDKQDLVSNLADASHVAEFLRAVHIPTP